MTQNNSTPTTTSRPKSRGKAGVWDWLLGATIGTFFRFVWWSIAAIFISILIEWAGMIWFWGPEHSQTILETELDYLSGFNRNMILDLYPFDITQAFMMFTESAIQFLRLRELSGVAANSISGNAGLIAHYGIESLLNTLFIFTVRLSICVSAVTGFALVGLVAFIDGLVERDIRRACGAMESAFVYHRAKRAVVPLIYLSFGGYLTAPVSVHPAVVFLPVMALFGLSIFTAAKQFKKFV